MSNSLATTADEGMRATYNQLVSIWATNMRTARRLAGLSQAAVAAGVGVDQTRVSRYEMGKTTPDPVVMIKIARFYGVSPRTMFDLDVNPDSERFKKLLQKRKRS